MRPPLDPAGFYGRIPLLPHQMTQRITKTADVIVLCHLGVPRLAADEWRLDIDGLVERPLSLGFADLQSFPFVRVESVHQCAGSPLRPAAPTRRISNVVWGGVRLIDVLAAVGVKPTAAYVWSTGCDYGQFENVACEAYLKDLPLSRIGHDVLLAIELNGAPLPPEHGYPVRLVVPGFYGTNSVKWLARLTLAAGRADGPFTTRWYNDPVLDPVGSATSATRPVWAIAPEGLITYPAPDQSIARGEAITVRGWAWADGGVVRVDMSGDGGSTWAAADLELETGRGWQAFAFDWVPTRDGPVTLLARARSREGAVQPMDGHRNSVHSVQVTVA